MLLPLFLLLSLLLPARSSAAYEPWWVQNHRATELWSGSDSGAVSFGRVPQWSYFRVVAPQQGGRLYVLNPATRDYAYINASDVGPSSAPPVAAASTQPLPSQDPAVLAGLPPAPRKMPVLPKDYEPWWVSNFERAELWAGPEPGAQSLGPVPQFRVLMVVEPQQGSRLKVWKPEDDAVGFVDTAVIGPFGPSVWLRAHPLRPIRKIDLPGRSVGSKAYVRNLPALDDETEIRWAPNNTPLQVREAVTAADGTEWYVVGEGEYIRASEVRLPRPPDSALAGRWIDADLREPAMVTAYEGDRAVYSGLAIKGTTAFSTPTGTFSILRRVQNETMDSETLLKPIPRDAPGGYYLKDVLYTQYFTWDGASLHYNYWLGIFGYPGSHGCLGLNLDDSKWLWDWAAVGTPVVVR